MLFAAGLACLTLPLVSPLDAAGEQYLVSAHMLQHMLIGDAAPALILLALRGPLLFFIVPAAVLRAVRPRRTAASGARLPAPARRRPVRVGDRLRRRGTFPSPTTSRSATDRARGRARLVRARRLPRLEPADRSRAPPPALARAAALFAGALFGLGQLLANVLLLSARPIYEAYAAEPERLFGWSALKDQQLAGIVMMGEQLVTLGMCALLLLLRSFRARPRPDRARYVDRRRAWGCALKYRSRRRLSVTCV